jgi:Rieske Fe-S protein
MTDPKPTLPQYSSFLSRRQFIHFGLAAVGTAWVGTLVQSRLFPSEQTDSEAVPVTIPLADLPVGGNKQITYGGLPVMVLRTKESIKAFSMICTHLSCTVQWRGDKKEFYCPCHDGYFDQFGEVIAGPPPVPLEQFPVNVVDEQVVIGEEV